MVLYAKQRDLAVPHPFQRAVVEVDVRQFDIGGQSGGIDSETVILRGDLDLARAVIEDGLIGPPVAEFQLERLRSQGQP
jgi:hypothetical protein